MDPIRRRRRSNLGKRPVGEAPRLLPVASFTVARQRGLGRVRSDKKEPPVSSHQKNPTANPTSYVKRLFLTSPQDSLGSISPQIGASVGKRLFSEVTHHEYNIGNISLNETGVNVIKSPGDFSSEKCSTNQSSKYLSSLEKYSIYDKLEPPVSPGRSRYSQLLLEELKDLKPPVDPDDCVNSLQLESLNLDNDFHKVTEETLKEDGNNTEVNSLSNKNEDLDTTDTFILAEKTIIDENQTLTDAQNEPTFKKPIPLAINNKRLDPVVEEEDSNSDDDLLKILEKCNQMSDQINAMSCQINNMKELIQCVINKQKSKVSCTENKENAPVPLSVNKKNNKWISDLKSENPSLLKTPKVTKPRLSMMEQSAIWTPHSLSSVLHEQMDELFD